MQMVNTQPGGGRVTVADVWAAVEGLLMNTNKTNIFSCVRIILEMP